MDSTRNRNYGGYRGNGEHAYRKSYGYSTYSGYSYGPYGYSGYGAPQDTTFQKSLQEMTLVVRERIWYILLAFLLVLGAVATYTFTRTPLYSAKASVEIFRQTPTVLQSNQYLDTQISSAEDLNTQVNILESQSIIDGVANQLTGRLRAEFLAPYKSQGPHPITVAQILLKNRKIIPEHLSYIIDVQYEHPNRAIAATVANLFADEYIAYIERLRVAQSMEAVDELRERADEQRKKVDGIAAEIQQYMEKYNLVSLDQRKDIVTEALKDRDADVTHASAALQIAETNWNQVQQCLRAGQSCIDLSFIASNPAVSALQQAVATQRILVAQLAQRYRAKHPKMIAAVSELTAAETQLRQAIQTATSQVQAQYQNAVQNYRKAQQALAAQEADSLRLDRFGLAYSNLQRDYLENEQILDQILASQLQQQQSSSGTLENEIARIIDRAVPPLKPSFPNPALNLSLGATGGLALGFALAFFVAYNDDRVKSAFDIETIIGLQLIGIIPKLAKLGGPDKIRETPQSLEARQAQEAFASILSTLQIKEESKKAQCILITSTVAGEGKTFISGGLAEVYAAHGERVLVIDCDLRRPAVNRLFHLENLKGLIDICEQSASLDDTIIKSVQPNLDVLPTGGRSKNPTQLLSGRAFAQMISDLRKRYDRIFIDTPPAGIVSDAFLIMPLVDGSIYSIYFNKVRRKAAQYSAQRLLEVNVPNFGAVLNGLSRGVGGYYYAHYYDRSYKDYYLTPADRSNSDSRKPLPPGRRSSGSGQMG